MQITVYEVGPRDGLQNEEAVISTTHKIELIKKLTQAGIRHIEATSLVHPKWIPQLSDATEVLAGVPRLDGVQYSVLTPNLRGLQRITANQVDEVAIFMSASETHNLKNINKTREDTYPVLAEVAKEAHRMGLRVRGYISTVFGCPYEGEVSLTESMRVVERLLAMGVYQLSIGDTIGVATPRQVHEVFAAFEKEWGATRFAGHFHDTRGTGLANVVAALQHGITTFDSSIGGLGGCPYAPGAAGNISTEDVVYLLHGMGYETGIQLDKLVEAGQFIQRILGRELPSKVLKSTAG
ncbi:hydroxymethylglutaryl-CoA lyase [Brevibacillus laterosporus]|uniref:Hydroxymethylglutaryl-CoA lyase n=1 Tax=Brevibacillus laterosporus TaxID=1465 RepID=A0AAP3DFG7_BRELA|nr:hydroxymethylglutaryl-CoA lyase [Brevibacillus laterosporus]MCR8980334.1 hydroxymethylglutaryl-CoA lyase [Brevibacillus laterosporus]MCZ0807489.1 hydroxymethylglutaryl-CoA lyase [Brevibacillus laterosporus]MCZ0825925.1 hydroxymethylglutaryl-CoA lyase [Brevibacillus laterosporus]MCZ0849611.1 hydroxymethylglutaryl-CoA lyase [Brevibacillus laterosporus]MED1663580.1 hydroxymethylglutaryl-CoA lyase [Brevibacillus laterosporus]